jgi:hypothetical protein
MSPLLTGPRAGNGTALPESTRFQLTNDRRYGIEAVLRMLQTLFAARISRQTDLGRFHFCSRLANLLVVQISKSRDLGLKVNPAPA